MDSPEIDDLFIKMRYSREKTINRVKYMINESEVIATVDELKTFLQLIENGGLGLENVTGVALATDNRNGRPFVAVLDDKHQLLLGRWVTQEVFDNGKDLVRLGVKN